MPRKRVISPEFWTDPKIMDLSPLARLLFIGCWNFADDKGVLESSIKKLKAQILPCDDVDIEKLVQELLLGSFIREFEIDNKKYWHIYNFLRWQKVEKPSNSALPSPPTQEESYSTPQGVGEESGRSIAKDKLSKDKLSKDNTSMVAEATPPTEVLDEVSIFVLWLAGANIFSGDKKVITEKARKKWKARRLKYSAHEIADAFSNLVYEPDRWKIENNGHRPLAWWLDSDDRIEEMKNCHLKKGSKPGVTFIS